MKGLVHNKYHIWETNGDKRQYLIQKDLLSINRYLYEPFSVKVCQVPPKSENVTQVPSLLTIRTKRGTRRGRRRVNDS